MSCLKLSTDEVSSTKKTVLIYGDPGTGKTVLALSAFAKPFIFDFEHGTDDYRQDFRFYFEQPEQEGILKMVSQYRDSILLTPEAKESIKTVIVDPATDYFNALEDFMLKRWEETAGVQLHELNQIQKTKWYAFRRKMTDTAILKLLALPYDIVFVARTKIMWGDTPKGLAPIGLVADIPDVLKNRVGIVINMESKGKAVIQKWRGIKNIPPTLELTGYETINEIVSKYTQPEPSEPTKIQISTALAEEPIAKKKPRTKKEPLPFNPHMNADELNVFVIQINELPAVKERGVPLNIREILDGLKVTMGLDSDDDITPSHFEEYLKEVQ